MSQPLNIEIQFPYQTSNKDFSIPLNNPNIEFHKRMEGLVKRITQNHIKNWKTYQKDSQGMYNLYRDLEYDHAFIQWIFPNFFNSMFNPNSRRLTLEERNEIIASEEYTAFYLDNFRMFMRFLGIHAIIDRSDYQFELIDETQFKVCVFENTHNLMRLQRVFASLSVLGQRELALRFLSFLKKKLQIFNDNQIYARDYQHFEMVKEEDYRSNITFQEIKNFYFQEDLLEKWNVNAKILTSDYISESEFQEQKIQNRNTLNQSESFPYQDISNKKNQNQQNNCCDYCDCCDFCTCLNFLDSKIVLIFVGVVIFALIVWYFI